MIRKKLALSLIGTFSILVVDLKAAEDRPVFVDRVDVELVSIEVVVSDADGFRVSGLRKEDFELYEDGDLVEVSHFYAADRAKTKTDAEGRLVDLHGGDEPDAGVEANEPAGHVGIFFDELHLNAYNRNRVLDDLQFFIDERLAAGDFVSIASYNGSFAMLQRATRDRDRVSQVLDQLATNSTFGNSRIETVHPSVAKRTKPGQSRVDDARQRILQSCQALSHYVKALGGLVGRKALVIVSEGFEKRPGFALAGLDRQSFRGRDPSPFEFMKEDGTKFFQEAVRHANAAQVTLYTVDPQGLRGIRPSISAESSAGATGAGTALEESLLASSRHEPLLDFADQTGGEAILNSANFERGLRAVTEDLETLYSLGFRPRRGSDGKPHKIEVKMTKPGLKVRHRSSFTAQPPAQRAAEKTYSALLLGAQKNPLRAELEIGVAEKMSFGRYSLPVRIRIPVDAPTLLPNGDQLEGQLQVFVGLLNDGKLFETEAHILPIKLSAARLATGEPILFETNLQIRAGVPRIAVTVWDELAGEESVLAQVIEVGESSDHLASKR